MHSKNVVHRDLKLDNMLLDEKMNIKVIDFGFAKDGQTSNLSQCIGTGPYMAPEIHNRQIYDGKAVDVFALGVILFIMVVGNQPFRLAKDDDPFYQKFKQGEYEEFFAKTRAKNTSNDFKNLMIKMLSCKSSERPTVEEIKACSWMR